MRLIWLALLVGTVCGGQQPQLVGPKIQPPDKPCDKQFEYEAITMADKPGYAGKVLCAPIMHEVTEKEFQQMLERIKALEDRLKCYGKPCFTGQ